MEEIEEFAHETVPLYKCPGKDGGCGWVFGFADSRVLELLLPQGVPEGIRYE